jgi:antitoxin (DNA-binding transcriptional repressor) of toxin-antitoxin stability system
MTSPKEMTVSQSQTITATDFKARCLEIFDRLASRKLTRVLVTKRGKVVAVLTPPDEPEASARLLYGFMEGSVIAPEGFDFTESALDEPFSAAGGKLHE